MNYVQLCAFLQFVKNDTVSFADIARVRNVERQAIAKMKNKELSQEEIVSICEAFEVKPPSEVDNVSIENVNVSDDKLQGKSFNIPYWEGINDEVTSRIKDDDITEFGLDLQFIIRKLKCEPENLRVISMLGDDMDGGLYPIKNKDLLVIDTSRNNTYESGVYFVTTHGGTRLYVRRIFERMSDSARYFTTIDNEIYKKEIEKSWTLEQWKEADVQIVGRVIMHINYFT